MLNKRIDESATHINASRSPKNMQLMAIKGKMLIEIEIDFNATQKFATRVGFIPLFSTIHNVYNAIQSRGPQDR